MPPKAKFTKNDIINAALELVKEQGIDALTARAVADRLCTSSKPIFGFFSGMDELKLEVMSAAYSLYSSCITENMLSGVYPPYKASGMAYIQFAKQQPQLFKLIFMCDRAKDEIHEERDEIRPLLDIIQKNLGITEDDAYIFHIEMWIYVHGIASMIATSYLDWDMDFASRALSDVYEGLKYKFTKEGK